MRPKKWIKLTLICDKNDELKNVIATLAIFYNITQNACNDLLRIFHRYTSCNLPTDIRTLLQTPRKTDIL